VVQGTACPAPIAAWRRGRDRAGAALVVLVVLMLGLTPFPRDAWWRESRLLPQVVVLAERARAWLPERIAAQIRLDGSEAPSPMPSIESTPT
jgi:membrane protein required for colicin V production